LFLFCFIHIVIGVQERDAIFAQSKHRRLRLGKHIRGKRAVGKFSNAEQQLDNEITERRQRGLVVTGNWIQMRMRHIVGNVDGHVFGSNWLYRFVRRWNLSWRRTTKRKQEANANRLPRMQRFHQQLRKLLIDQEGERGLRFLHPQWGRFLPKHRFNWDEIPWAFIGGLSHTWERQVRFVMLFDMISM
jgi:transposase